MDKPVEVFDREVEWAALARFATPDRAGARMAIVRGRRRHGKSTLLRALVDSADGLYHQALEGSSHDQLRDLGATIAAYRGLAAPLELGSWQAAVEVLFSAPMPPLVVLDEVSYLIDADPSLPSLLQRWLDVHGRTGQPLRLILCGSALSIMAGLLVGSAPLRGRASVELPIGAFGYVDARRFHGIEDPIAAVSAYAVVGGVPGYVTDLLDGDLPADRTDLDAWMVRGPLSRARPLLHEAAHLLDEPAVRDRATYLSVLSAVVRGATTNQQVASAMGRSTAAIAQVMQTLVELELLVRRDDPLRAKRPTWAVADPLLRFWGAVMRPDWARLEQGRAAEVWRDGQARWRSQVLGPAVEDLARRWVEDAEAEVGPLRQVAAAVVNDRAARTQHEVNIVGLDATVDGTRVAVIGEVKAGCVSAGELTRLRHVRQLLIDRGLADDATRLLLVGLEGVEPVPAADRGTDVVAVDGHRLYDG